MRATAPGIDVAQAALRGGSQEIALRIAGNVLASDPTNETALIVQGEALTELGQFDEASSSFEAVLQRNGTSVAAHIGIGRVRLASDPAAAEASFLQALQRDPNNAVALNDLGIARDLQGRRSDAQAAYRQAIAASPDMSAARVNLALSLAMSGQTRDAIQMLRPMASGPEASPQMRHDFAAVLTMGGSRAEAESILSKDLSSKEVQQALEAFAAARSPDATSLLTPGPPAAGPTASAAQPVEPLRAPEAANPDSVK